MRQPDDAPKHPSMSGAAWPEAFRAMRERLAPEIRRRIDAEVDRRVAEALAGRNPAEGPLPPRDPDPTN